MKKKTTKKPAFRFPKTFTATVTQSIFDASMERKTKGTNWSLMNDCPLAVAVRRALKLTRTRASASRVDCAVFAPSFKYRRYTHDGAELVKAFDQKLKVTLPQTVNFKLEKVEEYD